jgi:hypothetical protein
VSLKAELFQYFIEIPRRLIRCSSSKQLSLMGVTMPLSRLSATCCREDPQ